MESTSIIKSRSHLLVSVASCISDLEIDLYFFLFHTNSDYILKIGIAGADILSLPSFGITIPLKMFFPEHSKIFWNKVKMHQNWKNVID